MDIKEAFGLALRDIRLSKGVSQEKMAAAASRVYVSSLERGLKNPTLMTIEKLAKELDVHPLELISRAYIRKDAAFGVQATNLESVIRKYRKSITE